VNEQRVPLSSGLVRDGERMPPRAGNSSWVFARNFFAHPRLLGSAIPSSSFLINRVLRRVDWESARVIVEFGPGTGCFTREILKRLRPDGILLAIEMNPAFVGHLRSNVCDSRFRVFEGSAADVTWYMDYTDVGGADYVISGIPFSTIPSETRDAILRSTLSVLNRGGEMLVYQFSRAVLPHLRNVFPVVQTDFELLNILPARIFYCSRQGSPGTLETSH